MINVGENNITVYIGDTEISAIYAGDVQIYPNSTAPLTGISLDNLTWIIDVPFSGGTATSANCSFVVTGYYDDGRTRNITSKATITGSLVVPATTVETREYIGDLTLTATVSGFTDSATVGVYQEAYHIAYDKMYLTMEATGAGNIVLSNGTNSATSYRKNGGSWSSTAQTFTISVVAGDKVEWKSTSIKSGSNPGPWSATTAPVIVYGNIMSLLYSDNFTAQTSYSVTSWGLQRAFGGLSTMTSAENLYFPENISWGSYSAEYMFYGCTSLKTAPKTMTYDNTTLNSRCFDYCFYNCTSLETGPELLKTSVTNNAYRYMFYYCSSLKYVKCLLSSPNTNYQQGWMQGVGSSGTFIKNPNATWSTGVNGIPSGWTIIDNS